MEREGCLVKTIWDATRFPLIYFTTINMSCFSPSTVGEDSNIEIDSRHISIALTGMMVSRHRGICFRHLLQPLYPSYVPMTHLKASRHHGYTKNKASLMLDTVILPHTNLVE